MLMAVLGAMRNDTTFLYSVRFYARSKDIRRQEPFVASAGGQSAVRSTTVSTVAD